MHGSLFAMGVLAQQQGLTLHKVLVGIPHDATAIFVYLVTAGIIGFVVRAGLKTQEPGEG